MPAEMVEERNLRNTYLFGTGTMQKITTWQV